MLDGEPWGCSPSEQEGGQEEGRKEISADRKDAVAETSCLAGVPPAPLCALSPCSTVRPHETVVPEDSHLDIAPSPVRRGRGKKHVLWCHFLARTLMLLDQSPTFMTSFSFN